MRGSSSRKFRKVKALKLIAAAVSVLLLFILYSFSDLVSQDDIDNDGIPNPPKHMKEKTYGRTCTSQELESYVQQSPHKNSECPRTTYSIIQTLSENSERATHVTVHVGCNKGDDFISSLRILSRNATYSVKAMFQWMDNKGYETYSPCGHEEDVSLDNQPLNINPSIGYCIEPMQSTVKMLSLAFDGLGYSKSNVHLIHAAASNYPGFADFPNAQSGEETLGLHRTSEFDTVRTQLITLKTLFRQENISRIDHLAIDTEGHDIQVILGGIEFFVSHAIRFFEFEHNHVGRWAHSSLRDLIELVDSLEYDCYWDMDNGRLARLTGCWSDEYLQKGWSNVACISRNEQKTHAYMESLAHVM
jgi:FkbM family methyltransferase